MRDILHPDIQPSDPNPMRRAQLAMARQPLPKRFYREVLTVEADGVHAIHLDGRAARTPGRNLLALPTAAAAEVVALEWRAQEGVIDPARMHATRIANTAIDSLGGRLDEIRADIARYASSDLVCYRAEEPEGLAARQREAWDPVLDWARSHVGADFQLAGGIIHVDQPPAALAAVATALAREGETMRLAALHVLTTLSGSCLIALKFGAGAIGAEAAFAASTIDEDWNADAWGRDAEAEARQDRRREEFLAAAALLAALPG
jgi:chaperone required for assembly of F1-ATPase